MKEGKGSGHTGDKNHLVQERTGSDLGDVLRHGDGQRQVGTVKWTQWVLGNGT